MSERLLAIAGGRPIRTKAWPAWPRADRRTESEVIAAIRSGQWTISSCHVGTTPYEKRFAEDFARFLNVPYCVPAANGTAALSIALQALGLTPGDEVLVPGLAWVACASAVFYLGSTPVLVDVDPDTLCMSVDAAEAAITARTKGILLVHLYCRLGDLPRFVRFARKRSLFLIEDCSHSHGAEWRGKRAGTFGDIGIFSMHQSKVLTCGEGGAAVTRDSRLFDAMQQFRADGRRYSASSPNVGDLELEDAGTVLGRNLCLSEFQAAVLIDRLRHLDSEIEHRERNGRHLETLLETQGLARPLYRSAHVTRQTYFRFCIRINGSAFGGKDVDSVAAALSKELSLPVCRIEEPLNAHPLYRPLSSPIANCLRSSHRRLDPSTYSLPESERAWRECVTLPHNALLGNDRDLNDILDAFRKVAALHDHLAPAGRAKTGVTP